LPKPRDFQILDFREEKIGYEDILYSRDGGRLSRDGRYGADLGRRIGVRERFRVSRSGKRWS
jgi:hypothetical protein